MLLTDENDVLDAMDDELKDMSNSTFSWLLGLFSRIIRASKDNSSQSDSEGIHG